MTLGKELGRGGEGAVYEVHGEPDLVAKIYHKGVPAEKAAKLEAMAALQSRNLLSVAAWPVDVLKTEQGAPCGLLMPRVSGHRDVHKLYSPKSRKAEFPNADWRFLLHVGVNTCRAFAAVHDAGCVIGDVNHGGVAVSQNGTVKLIDCDSFQVTVAGRQFFCDVGVPTFTPPELQRRSLRGVGRSQNHDGFGLAVLLFHLLFMGRHPFAGRFRGAGDMPVERAIQEFRFAYGANRAALMMDPPPGTPPLAIVSSVVADSFERAFSRDAVARNSRPTAKEWIAVLEALQRNVRQCDTVSVHFFPSGLGACPWCNVEAASGVVLFNIQLRPGSSFDIATLWSKIQALAPMGAPPIVIKQRADYPVPLPLEEATGASLTRTRQLWTGGWIATVLAVCLAILFPQAIPFFVTGYAIVMYGIWEVTSRRLRDRFGSACLPAEARYRAAREHWDRQQGSDDFRRKFVELERAKAELQDLPSLRQRRYRQLEADCEQKQRDWFLEAHEIDKAHIRGIGPGRKATLRSFNIETAFDCKVASLSQVPGFGPAMTKNLLDWRASVERGFRFDPSKGVDRRDSDSLDRDILQMQRKLEDRLMQGATQLMQLRNATAARVNALKAEIETALQALLQAEADRTAAMAVGGIRSGLSPVSGIVPIMAAIILLTFALYRPLSVDIRVEKPPPSPRVVQATAAPAASVPLTIPTAPNAQWALVSREMANIRDAPAMSGRVVRRVKQGERILLGDQRSGEWCAVVKESDASQVVGWVHKNVISQTGGN